MRVSVQMIGLAAALCGCAGSSKPTPAAQAATANAPPETPSANEAIADEKRDAGQGDADPAAEPESADACTPRNSPLPQAVCQDARLAPLLAKFDESDKTLSGIVRCQPLAVEDLESVQANAGKFGDVNAGPGFFGAQDVDGDGKPDLVLHYSSVDYWAWFLFVRQKDCLRFVEAVSGYQVELLPTKHNGVRDVRVLTYPLQGHIEKRHFDGKTYAP
jgi:hypothetical protein